MKKHTVNHKSLIMKKIILVLAISISTLSAFAKPEEVNPKVLNAFTTEFNTAREIQWTVGSSYYKAEFTYNESRVFAFYSLDGELLGLTRYISPLDLPISLQTSIKSNYSKYWISDLFECAKAESTSYYITLENADAKIVLRASNGGGWSVYKKTKKA
jgi:hypothetical protein